MSAKDDVLKSLALGLRKGTSLILPMGECFKYGEEIARRLYKEMPTGIPVMYQDDMSILTQMICSSQGDHLEIGSAFGGSALVAALAMEHAGRSDTIVCIDPHVKDGFWENVEAFGLRKRIMLISKPSHPFPVNGRVFGSAFIDGDHSTIAVNNDWKNTKEIVTDYIMFHDYDGVASVRKAIRDTVVVDKNWAVSHVCGQSLVMKKC